MRSPHAQGWVRGLQEIGYDVQALSSFEGVVGMANTGTRSFLAALRSRLPTKIGQLILTMEAVVKLGPRGSALRRKVSEFSPHLIHVLRMPYEGVTALSSLRESVPVVGSVWGIDFTEQASQDPLLRHWLRLALPKLDGLHVDATSDVMRAHSYGLPKDTPTLHAAGNFGIEITERRFPKEDLIVAPRGVSSRMRLDVMLEGLERYINTSGFTGTLLFLKADRSSKIKEFSERVDSCTVEIRGSVTRDEFLDILDRARVVLSPSRADGMPNTVLEAVAAGAVPVASYLPQFDELLEAGARLVTPPQEANGEEFSDAIAAAMSLSAGGEANVLPEPYRWETNLIRVAAFYDSVLDRTTTARRCVQ